MPRIPYPDDPAQSPDRLNLARMLDHLSPTMRAGFAALTAGVRESPIDSGLRELAILRVGYARKCDYELFHHVAAARFVGMSEANIAALAEPVPGGNFLAVERATIAFVDDLLATGHPSDAHLARLREHLSCSEILDLVMVTGCYWMVCNLIETSGIELDARPIANEGRIPRSALLSNPP